ncbi:MAG: hypothetical protein M9894_31550 [Planctomycetes bacterium]|nr:hypothetical protein [Planctomycetota bacterium]
MEDALAVREGQRPGQGLAQAGGLARRDALLAPQARGQALPLDQVHDQVGGRAVDAEVVHADHPRVPQLAGRARLAAEALEGRRPRPAVDHEQLDGHGAVDRRVARAVDHPHAAAGQLPFDHVAADGLARAPLRLPGALARGRRRQVDHLGCLDGGRQVEGPRQRLEVRREGLGVGVAARRVGLAAAAAHLVQAGRQGGVVARGAAGERDLEQRAERVDVGGRPALRGPHLRRRVALVRRLPRAPEAREHRLAARSQQDVLGAHQAVDHPVSVRVMERPRERGHERGGPPRPERPLALQALLERLGLDQLEDHEADAAVRADGADRGEVGVA